MIHSIKSNSITTAANSKTMNARDKMDLYASSEKEPAQTFAGSTESLFTPEQHECVVVKKHAHKKHSKK